MRAEPTILHLDLDAFFAAVEQRDKPSLRGKPVVVGGVGGRGVVATASYEARRFGVGSAMSTREARNRCPHAAFLGGRHHIYRLVSEQVMGVLAEVTPLVEPLSFDEAFLDLAVIDLPDRRMATLLGVAATLKTRVEQTTGGLTASVGLGTSKLVAKIASDLHKPDGLVAVPAGTERMLLHPMPVTRIPGVGPATAQRLRQLGLVTIADLAGVSEDELVRVVGQAHGSSLARLARADDDRPVVAEREAKSISAEDTYDTDLTDRRLLEGLVTRQAGKVAQRLRSARLSGRTVTLKVRHHDFSTHTRSRTLQVPTDAAGVIAAVARNLLAEVDVVDGLRLLGVGVSGLADWIQDDLFGEEFLASPGSDPVSASDPAITTAAAPTAPAAPGTARTSAGAAAEEWEGPDLARQDRWHPGADVEHTVHGRGWVWGAGLGRVTVRFETALTDPGPVLTLAADDPELTAWRPDPPDEQR